MKTIDLARTALRLVSKTALLVPVLALSMSMAGCAADGESGDEKDGVETAAIEGRPVLDRGVPTGTRSESKRPVASAKRTVDTDALDRKSLDETMVMDTERARIPSENVADLKDLGAVRPGTRGMHAPVAPEASELTPDGLVDVMEAPPSGERADIPTENVQQLVDLGAVFVPDPADPSRIVVLHGI